MRIYLAAPLFSQVQRNWNRQVAEQVQSLMPGVAVTLPQDFRPEGRYNDPKHYGVLFRRCLGALSDADVLVAVLDGADVDSGAAFEMGVAHAMGKIIIGVRTDYRPGPDHGVNLMCARACRYMVREFGFQERPETVAHAVVRRLRKIQESQHGS